ncbi:MAG: Gfo/Idh/MocA family oxidoreductase [bacterium]|nr:Gfo/Idh/MocA family oxidoreductase [bacterium]
MTDLSAGAPLRLGLIGAGSWGRNYIRTIAEMPRLALSRLCSRNPESRAMAGAACACTEDWREIIAAGDVDGLIVAIPPALHAEIAAAALEAHIPVLIEKPLALDLENALRLHRLAEKTSTPAMVNHIHLFHPAYRRLKQEAAALGTPMAIRSEGGNRGPFRADTPPLWDYGPHDIALCLDLLQDEPHAIEAKRERSEETEEGYGEVIAVRMDFAGGARAHIRCGNLMEKKRRWFGAYFEKEVLVFNDLADEKLRRHSGFTISGNGEPPMPEDEGTPVPVADTPPLTAALDVFAAAIRGENPPGAGLDLAVKVIRALERCTASLGAP